MTLGLIFFTWIGKVDGKDFVLLIGQVFAFYFGQKQMTPQPGSVTVTPPEAPSSINASVSTTDKAPSDGE